MKMLLDEDTVNINYQGRDGHTGKTTMMESDTVLCRCQIALCTVSPFWDEPRTGNNMNECVTEQFDLIFSKPPDLKIVFSSVLHMVNALCTTRLLIWPPVPEFLVMSSRLD